MPFLGSKSCHESCSLRIFDYLEIRDGQSRALGHDFFSLMPGREQEEWANRMDFTRHMNGNDINIGEKSAVTYQHFVISPDPQDEVDLDTLRSLTTEWAEEMFGNEFVMSDTPGDYGSKKGVFGIYEVAIIYHDDNTNKVPHAHVIVNNTNLTNGKRLQISKHDNEVVMPNRLQEIAREHGLHYFDNNNAESNKTQKKGRYYTKKERSIIRSGKFSWKQNLADLIDIAKQTSTDEKTFLNACEKFGIQIEEKDGDWIFYHPKNQTRWKASGYRIGQDYTKEALLESIDMTQKTKMSHDRYVRDNTQKYVHELFEQMERNSQVIAEIEFGQNIKQVLNALNTTKMFNIESDKDFTKALNRIDKRIENAKTLGINTDSFIASKQRIIEAQEISQKANLFVGVKPKDKKIQRIKTQSKDSNKSHIKTARRKESQKTAKRRSNQRKVNTKTRQNKR